MTQVSYGTITITDTNDIESITIEYASNQSTTTPPAQTDSSWSTNRPTWAQGYYIWQRTRTHKSGTQASEDILGNAVCLTGSTGQTGATGRGVTGVETLYATNNSATTAPTSGWQTQPPTYDSSNPKYWVKVTTTYNSGNPDIVTYLDNGITDAMATANSAKDKADTIEGNLNSYITSNNNVVTDLQTRTKYFWTNLVAHTNSSSGWTKPDYPVGTYAAGGIDGTTFDEENSSTYGYNTLYSNGIKLRYNAFNLGELTGTSLVFYKPSTASQGTMAMKLDGTSLNFYDSTGQTVQASFGGTQATVSGTINAYDGVISGSVTIGGVLASVISSKSNCITEISGNGIWVTPSNFKPDANGDPDNDTTGTLINASGLSIYSGGRLVANYGSDITLGEVGSPRFKVQSTGIGLLNATGTSDIFNINSNPSEEQYKTKEVTINFQTSSDVSPGSQTFNDVSIRDLSSSSKNPWIELSVNNGEFASFDTGVDITIIDRTSITITISQAGVDAILDAMSYPISETYELTNDTTIVANKNYYVQVGTSYVLVDFENDDSLTGEENPYEEGWFEISTPASTGYYPCTLLVTYYALLDIKSALMNMIGNLKVTGTQDIVSVINTDWSDNDPSDTYFHATNDTTGTSVAFGVGKGGINHGVWSTTRGHWLIYGSDDSYIRIPKATLIGSPSDYGTTTDASRINAGYIQLSKNGGSSYIQIRSGQYAASFTITKDGARGLYDSEKQKWIIYSPKSGGINLPQNVFVINGYIQVTNNATAGASVFVQNNSRRVALHSSNGGYRGIYDTYKGKWIIYSPTGGTVYIPQKLTISSGGLSVTGGATIATGSLAISSGDISVTDNTNASVAAICNSKNIALHCNTVGNRGIYDATGQHWLIYTDDEDKAKFTVPIASSSSITAGGSIVASANADILVRAKAGAGDIYMHCYNSSTGTKGIYTHNASGTAQSIFQVEQSGNTNFGQTVQFTKHTFVNNGELSVATAHSVDVHVSAVWSDGEYHDLMYKAKSTNDAYFGGAKGLSITTNTYLRGDTVKLQDSSGSAVTSDRNIKKDIVAYDSRYDEFYDLLKPISYKYIHGHSGRAHCGFIAQEVRDALSSAGLSTTEFGGYVKDKITHRELDSNGEDIKKSDVNYLLDKNINEMHHLIYSEFISLNTWQIQKLKARVSELEEELEKIKKTIGDN